jgi:hypothetical protein
MARHRRGDPALQAFWSRHVAAWMRSPFSQMEYRERHGLSRTMMWRWRKWLGEDRVDSATEPISVVESSSPSSLMA